MAQPAYVVIGKLREFLTELQKLAHETGGSYQERHALMVELANLSILPDALIEPLYETVMDVFREERETFTASDEFRRLNAEDAA